MAQINIIEYSKGARNLFNAMLPEAALFHLPSFLIAEEPINIATGGRAAREWIDNGVMPFALTALEVHEAAENPNGVARSETVVANLVDGELHFVMRFTGMNDEFKTMFFIEAQMQGEQGRIISPTDEWDYDVKTRPIGQRMSTSMITYALQRLNWLIEALGSKERSAFKRPRLNRNQAKATHYPRESWEITLRPKYAKGVPSNKEIFHKVMAAAHVVRGHGRKEHLRTNPRTGVKNIIVSAAHIAPHVRGTGDVIQLKDYKFKGFDKK
jgi:hypothetical protein